MPKGPTGGFVRFTTSVANQVKNATEQVKNATEQVKNATEQVKNSLGAKLPVKAESAVTEQEAEYNYWQLITDLKFAALDALKQIVREYNQKVRLPEEFTVTVKSEWPIKSSKAKKDKQEYETSSFKVDEPDNSVDQKQLDEIAARLDLLIPAFDAEIADENGSIRSETVYKYDLIVLNSPDEMVQRLFATFLKQAESTLFDEETLSRYLAFEKKPSKNPTIEQWKKRYHPVDNELLKLCAWQIVRHELGKDESEKLVTIPEQKTKHPKA